MDKALIGQSTHENTYPIAGFQPFTPEAAEAVDAFTIREFSNSSEVVSDCSLISVSNCAASSDSVM